MPEGGVYQTQEKQKKQIKIHSLSQHEDVKIFKQKVFTIFAQNTQENSN